MDLVIGSQQAGGESVHLSWNGLPESLPLIANFKRIVVIPSEGSADIQKRTLYALQDQISLMDNDPPQVTWILNYHSIPEVATSTGCGKLVPIRSINGGRIESAMPIAESAEIHFAFHDIDFGAIPFAQLIYTGGHRFVVGVVSPDGNWILTPSVGDQGESNLDWSLFQRVSRTFALAIFALALLITWSFVRSHNKNLRHYKAGIKYTSAFVPWGVRKTLENELSSNWRGADARAVNRLVSEDLDWLLENSSSLGLSASPYHLWQKANEEGEEDLWPYLDIAFLAGDLESFQKIVNETTNEYELYTIVDWSLPKVLWQTAVESLHEGNFRRTRIYASLYINDHYLASKRVDIRGALSTNTQKSISLAQIMRREFKSGRILSLCQNQGISKSFGLASSRIPNDVPGLNERRRVFQEKFCGTTTIPQRVNYNALEQLSALNSRDPAQIVLTNKLEACSIAPAECEYMRLRAAISRAATPRSVDELLHFASQCSYLSDDAVVDVIDEMSEFEAGNKNIAIKFDSLAKAVLCVDSSSDELLSVKTRLDEFLRCNWIDWNTWQKPVSPMLQTIETKCRAEID